MLNSIYSAKAFGMNAENMSDHLPIELKLNLPEIADCVLTLNDECCINSRNRHKIKWSNLSSEKIHEKFVTPLLADLSLFDMGELNDSKIAAEKISQLLVDHWLSLVSPSPPKRNKSSKVVIYVKLPGDLKTALSCCKAAFESWKERQFLVMATSMTPQDS